MTTRDIAGLAAATLLFSLVAVIVKAIGIPAGLASLGRGLFAAIALALVLAARRENPFSAVLRRDIPKLSLLGVFMAGNWFFYFAAINVSTVAVAVISLFTYPLITALIEPFVFKYRHSAVDCVAALVVVAGVALVVPSLQLTNRTTLGVLFGILSATSVSLRNIFSKRMIDRYTPTTLIFTQFLASLAIFIPLGLAQRAPLSTTTVGYLAVMGAFLTALPQFLFVRTLKRLSATTASILISLQPFFTVLFAFLLLGEVPSARTLAGGLAICCTVVTVTTYHALDRREPAADPT